MSIFEVTDHSALWHDLSAHLHLPTSVCVCVCVCVCGVSVKKKGKEAQHLDTVKCSMSPLCTWQIIRHTFRASLFRQMQKQGRFALRVNVIIGTVWLWNQIRTCHRTGYMVMLESVVARVRQNRWVYSWWSMLFYFSCTSAPPWVVWGCNCEIIQKYVNTVKI